MSTQQSGLRFDIYERVHLSEGVLSIKELEGVELVPHIQVLPEGDQAVLRGNLLLSGTYVDERDQTGQTLEHLIPVEITLPMNRVHRVEDISVEIENFDVDLLSNRSLNVTGVLSLNGIEVVSTDDSGQWQQKEEEVVFIHEADSSSIPSVNYPIREDSQAVPNMVYHEVQQEQEAYPQQHGVYTERSEQIESNSVQTEWTAEELGPEAEVEFEAPAEAKEEKKEMKIGFNSKGADQGESAPVYKNYGLSTLLNHPASASPQNAIPRKPGEVEDAETEGTSADKLKWKNLLLSARDENQEFKRLRMVIVQKEETLETIAKRYDLNPREIALYNRLGESEVSAGQIVYIPK